MIWCLHCQERRGERAKHKKQDYVVQSLFLILNESKFVGLTWQLTLGFFIKFFGVRLQLLEAVGKMCCQMK